MPRIYPRNRYVPGTYKRECAICGFDFLRSEMRKQWNGLVVHSKCFDTKPKHLRKRRHIRERPFKRD
jgi:hypothetical protein